VNREQVRNWVTAYERAWRAPGTSALAEIFTADARYQQGPYDEPVVGLAAIGRMWEAEREGPDEVFRMTSDVVAADGDTAVVRAEVSYGDPVRQEFRDCGSSVSRGTAAAPRSRSGRSGRSSRNMPPAASRAGDHAAGDLLPG